MKCGTGTPSACRIAANASGPFDSLAMPCCTKPYPTIKRNGSGAHRAARDWFRNFKSKLRTHTSLLADLLHRRLFVVRIAKAATYLISYSLTAVKELRSAQIDRRAGPIRSDQQHAGCSGSRPGCKLRCAGVRSTDRDQIVVMSLTFWFWPASSPEPCSPVSLVHLQPANLPASANFAPNDEVISSAFRGPRSGRGAGSMLRARQLERCFAQPTVPGSRQSVPSIPHAIDSLRL
jgi:hypothetical protein